MLGIARFFCAVSGAEIRCRLKGEAPLRLDKMLASPSNHFLFGRGDIKPLNAKLARTVCGFCGHLLDSV
jgi:hypothetical protein